MLLPPLAKPMAEQKARSIGFLNVISASGNIEALKELIFRTHEKKDED